MMSGPGFRIARLVLVAVLLSGFDGVAAPMAANDTRLVDAVMRRDKPVVRSLLRDRVDVNTAQPDGSTALHWAVRGDDFETTQLLIRAGAKISVATRYGVTPIYLACANGNVVTIDHGKGISTVYGHMSRFGKSARVGRAVKQGDIIGYVGMTGAATGPHLHYEYRIKGVHKNPATIPMPRTEIPSNYLAEFHSQSQSALAKLQLTSGPGGIARVAGR
jgi:hypothetical protein